MSTRNLLVPVDFTSAAETAVTYALSLAKHLNAEVNLLHLIKDSKDVKKGNDKFTTFLSKINNAQQIKINPIVKVGDIFKDIANVASEQHSTFVIMGTHGAKGMQKVFGSFAIKVITSSHVPFIIVQEGNKYFDVKNITVPYDTSKESLQIEQVVTAICKYTGANVHLAAEKYSDSALKIKVSVHFGVLSKQFQEEGVSYDMEYIPKLSAKEVVKHAKKTNSDLIAVSYYNDSIISFDRYYQDLITNDEKIPCMIINSKEAGNYFF